jgi:hypothetical protein
LHEESARYSPAAKYEAVFKEIILTVEFKIAEVRQLAPDWAIARTNSEGTVKVNASGEGGPEANQELPRVSESERRLENRTLLLLHNQSSSSLIFGGDGLGDGKDDPRLACRLFPNTLYLR